MSHTPPPDIVRYFTKFAFPCFGKGNGTFQLLFRLIPGFKRSRQPLFLAPADLFDVKHVDTSIVRQNRAEMPYCRELYAPAAPARSLYCLPEEV